MLMSYQHQQCQFLSLVQVSLLYTPETLTDKTDLSFPPLVSWACKDAMKNVDKTTWKHKTYCLVGKNEEKKIKMFVLHKYSL